MRRRHLILGFTLVPLLFLVGCSAPSKKLTLEEAAQKVLEEVVRPDEPKDEPLIAFAWPTLLQEGDLLHPYEMEGYGPFPEHLVIEQQSWFFWIDDAAGALFLHPNRFVVVGEKSGELTVLEQDWWPVLNGESLWVSEDDYWNSENWIYSNIEQPPTSGTPRHLASVVPVSWQPAALQLPPSGSAIVLNMWETGQSQGDTLNESADQMHDILTDAGFDTTYLGPKEDKNKDRDGEPESTVRRKWFDDQKKKLKASQTLFIYITGHGGKTDAGVYGLGNVYEDWLKDRLTGFDLGVHIIVVLDGCYSGGFIDSLQDVADITITSTSEDKKSWGDWDRWFRETDVNPDDKGLEFTSGFVEDWKELLSTQSSQQGVKNRAKKISDNFWERLSAESHVSAVDKDFARAMGWSDPQFKRGTTATKPTATPAPKVSSLLDKVNDGISCRTGEFITGETAAHLDIGGVTTEFSLGEVPIYNIYIELPRVEQVTGEIFGGIEFNDPSREISEPMPDWFFEGRGNTNFAFFISPPNVFPEMQVYENGAWSFPPAVQNFEVNLEGNVINVQIPASVIPPNSFYYVSLTDFDQCDEVGLNADLLPEGQLPPVPIFGLPGGMPSSGVIDATISLDEDPAGHAAEIQMPGAMQIRYDASTDSITFTGAAPWVTVTGAPLAPDGSFFSNGFGTVMGRSDIFVGFSGTIQDGLLQASLLLGADGGLPDGMSLTYQVEGDLLIPVMGPSTPTPMPSPTPEN